MPDGWRRFYAVTGASKTACIGYAMSILGEDASRIRTGHAPQVMAIFRNMAVGLLGLLGFNCPSEGLRHFAWNPAEAIKVVTRRPKSAARTTLK